MKKQINLLLMASALAITVGIGSIGFGYGYGLSQKDVTRNQNKAIEHEIVTFTDTPAYTSVAFSGNVEGVASIVDSASDAVVSINVFSQGRNYFNRIYNQQSAGSGFIIHDEKDLVYIATNNHVVSGSSEVYISVDDNISVPASIVGLDRDSDLAVLSVKKTDIVEAGMLYKVARLGDSDSLRVGDCVVAIGNALGEGKIATSGIVSAKNKQISIDGKTFDVIQTDAAINPGNSGGALVNSKGEVVGINTAKLLNTGIEGMGYSIPINEAMVIIETLVENGSIPKPFFGISGISVTEDVKNVYSLHARGVYITSVTEGSGAKMAGVKIGDIITEFNGVTITNSDDISREISSLKVGQTVTLKVNRQGIELELQALIGDYNKLIQ